MGYDLLNEPFTPDDVAQGYFDEMPSTYVGTLNELYRKAIAAIRDWDSETPIILESTYWASPRTLQFLQTYDDKSDRLFVPYVCAARLYHAWDEPFPLRLPRPGQEMARTPTGAIRSYWDKETIRAFLEEVKTVAAPASNRRPKYLRR